MKPSLVAAFAAVVAMSSVGLAQDFIPLRDLESRHEFYGVSVLPPKGEGWMVMPAMEGHGIQFQKLATVKKARKNLHTISVAVAMSWLGDCDGAAACLEMGVAAFRESKGQPGIRTITFESSREDVSQETCVRFTATQEDTRVPGRVGKAFEVHSAGLMCTHPEEASLFVNPFYSQRFKKGGMVDDSVGPDVAPFLESLEFEPLGSRVASVAELGTTAGGIATGPDGLWVLHGAEVSQIDPETGQPSRTISGPAKGLGLAYAHGSLWFGHDEQPTISRLDPEAGTVIASIATASQAYNIVPAHGAIWAALEQAGKVSRIDPLTNRIVAEIAIGGLPMGIAATGNSLWISDSTGGKVYRVDPATNEVVTQIEACGEPLDLASVSDGTAVWVACGSGEIVRIDASKSEVSGSLLIGGSPLFLVSDGDSLWVGHVKHGTVSRVDVAEEPVIETLPLGAGTFAVRTAFDSVWITDYPLGKLFRISSKSRSAEPAHAGMPSPDNALQPENDRPSADVLTSRSVPEVLMMGEASAPLKMEAFTDFAWSLSAKYHQQTFPRIKEKYIETGKLQYQHRAFPIEIAQQRSWRRKTPAKESRRAAEAAVCAAEQGLDKFWEFYGKLMEGYKFLGRENYKQWAFECGLDEGSFVRCLDSGRSAAAVQRDIDNGKAAGVKGTPTFFLNGKIIKGARPYEFFEEAIEAELTAIGSGP